MSAVNGVSYNEGCLLQSAADSWHGGGTMGKEAIFGWKTNLADKRQGTVCLNCGSMIMLNQGCISITSRAYKSLYSVYNSGHREGTLLITHGGSDYSISSDMTMYKVNIVHNCRMSLLILINNRQNPYLFDTIVIYFKHIVLLHVLTKFQPNTNYKC